MRTLLLAMAFGGLVLGAAGAASAGQPIGGIVVKGGCNPAPNDPCPHKTKKADFVIVELPLTKPAIWRYDPSKGALQAVAADQAGEGEPMDVAPVLKDAKGTPLRLTPGKFGYDLPALEDGTYSLAVNLPADRLTEFKGKGVRLTFTLVRNKDGLFDQAALDGEKAAPTAQVF